MRIEKILLVDDDPSIRMVAEISLTRVGKWHVTKADSGRVALELASKVRPDLILLDVMMPGMDGPTTFGKLKEFCNAPVIFITAKIQKHEVDNYLNLGAAGVIAKPFDPMTLPAEIQKILNGFSPNALPEGFNDNLLIQYAVPEQCPR